ncbi:ACL146Cp [Eremothecium gossypii ATCC 10895]|uniref:ACL146Cp n=1 Tax=Eremothecium gossypii (strain ATCC 10895 / CBS 109.51 / FGSC 9923 / NRRL Y-1056) TaxID=284811 RepID=Q75CR5_EREGS|nr:ACL146Cp [Eremothecium gossypii ATCC 10895]AAS51082.1 ACL146Cp [Eremothecium gossypii ATCC 10895]AEY95372.1 FACL146Cp [Eremothecium gossypii FDAG1]
MSAEQVATKYTQLQGELEELVVTRQKLETQLQENKIVNEELQALQPETQVYKLTGGVLLPVEQEEAEGNVSKRLEFIEGEIRRCEQNIKQKQEEMEGARAALVKLRG